MESKSNGDEMNIKVAVRCRPLNEDEKKGNVMSCVRVNPDLKKVRVSYGSSSKRLSKDYTFDSVFGTYSTQREVFDTMVRPVIEEVMAGYNCTVFAYGQTGTGKTHTMEGCLGDEQLQGVIPRSISNIFSKLENYTDFSVRVSFLELYNEELSDLLLEESMPDKPRLRLCVDSKTGAVTCQNLQEVSVMNEQEVFRELQRGIEQRRVAETRMNKHSSRSHSIFTIKIMMKETLPNGEDYIRNGQLNLVDLAGSECIGRSGATHGRAREAGNINQSLLTLGRVITALVEHHPHIPYRDSKLTRLLQESLGGRAKTCIIATLSPSSLSLDESLSTLDYANRARSIKNKPEVNQKLSRRSVMKEYGAEMEQMRRMLHNSREKNGIYMDPNDYDELMMKIETYEAQLEEAEQSIRVRREEAEREKALRLELQAEHDSLVSERDFFASRSHVLGQHLEGCSLEVLAKMKQTFILQQLLKQGEDTETSLRSLLRSAHGDITDLRSDCDVLQKIVSNHVSFEQAMKGNIASVEAQLAGPFQEKTSADFEKLLQEMSSNNEQLSKEIQSIFESSTSELNSFVNVFSSSLSSNMNSLTSFFRSIHDETVQNNWLPSVEANVQAFHDTMQEQLVHLQEQVEASHTQSTTILSSLEEAVQTLKDMETHQEEQHEQVQTSLERVHEEASSFSSNTSQLLVQFVADMERKQQEYETTIRSLQEENETRRKNDQSQLLNQIASLLDQQREKEAEAMDSIVTEALTVSTSTLNNTIKPFTQAMEEKTGDYLVSTQENVTTIVDIAHASFDHMIASKESLDEQLKVAKESEESVQASLSITQETLHTMSEKTLTSFTNEELPSSFKDLSSSLQTALIEDTTTQLTTLSDELTATVQTNIEDSILPKIQEAHSTISATLITSHEEVVMPLVSSLASEVTSTVDTVIDDLASIRAEDVVYVTKEGKEGEEELVRPYNHTSSYNVEEKEGHEGDSWSTLPSVPLYQNQKVKETLIRQQAWGESELQANVPSVRVTACREGKKRSMNSYPTNTPQTLDIALVDLNQESIESLHLILGEGSLRSQKEGKEEEEGEEGGEEVEEGWEETIQGGNVTIDLSTNRRSSSLVPHPSSPTHLERTEQEQEEELSPFSVVSSLSDSPSSIEEGEEEGDDDDNDDEQEEEEEQDENDSTVNHHQEHKEEEQEEGNSQVEPQKKQRRSSRLPKPTKTTLHGAEDTIASRRSRRRVLSERN